MSEGKLNFLSGLSTVGDVAATIFNPISTLLTNKQNEKIALANRNFQYNMWKENNAYNTPLAQLQRLEDAGYNPNMFQAGSNVSNAPAQGVQMPQMQAPQVDPTSFGRSFQNYLTKLQTTNTIANIKADTAKKQAEEALAKENKRLVGEQSNYYNSLTNKIDTLLPLEAKVLTSQAEMNSAQKELTMTNKNWVDKLNQSTVDLNNAKIIEIGQHVRLMASQIGLNNAQAYQVQQTAQIIVQQLSYWKQHGYPVEMSWQNKIGDMMINLVVGVAAGKKGDDLIKYVFPGADLEKLRGNLNNNDEPPKVYTKQDTLNAKPVKASPKTVKYFKNKGYKTYQK